MSLLDGIKTIRDLPIENQRVFVRVDFNVPMDGERITDDTRIREALPTLKHGLERGARLVLGSHMGRPKPGETDGLSLLPCGERLAELLGIEVLLPESCVGDAAKKAVYDLREGQICLLENLRFEAGEEANDEAFARELRGYADIYVNDAFGAAHRAHASVHALPKMVQERGCGLLVEKEILSLGKLITGPEKPFVAILGGAKVSDKILVIEALLERVQVLLIGGAMANTFLAAKGRDMRGSKVEGDKLALARTLLEKAEARKVEVLLPSDVVVANSISAEAGEVRDVGALGAGEMALDIGPKTIAAFVAKIAASKTVFWNGPMGLFEKKPFSRGTFDVAKGMAASGAFTVVGGGDSAAAVHAAGEDIASKMGHISTGGGAALELIEGKKLPGLEALRKPA